MDSILNTGAFLKFLGSGFYGSWVTDEGNRPSDLTPQPYKATSKLLGWIRKTMHICGLSQFQQKVELLARLKCTWSKLLGTVLKYLGDVFCGSWVANEGNGPFDSTHSPMWVTTTLQIYKKKRSVCGRLKFVLLRTANTGRISQSTRVISFL